MQLQAPTLLHRFGHHWCKSCKAVVKSHVQVVRATQWLEQASTTGISISSLSASIIHQADSLQQRHQPHMAHQAHQADMLADTAAAYSIRAAKAVPTDLQQRITLQEQQLHISSSFAASQEQSIPVHQLVAVFSSMLGSPVLPRDATRMLTMEGKWRCLQLLLLHAAGDAEAFEQSLRAVVDYALYDSSRKALKVCLNSKVPQVNKDSVKERYIKLEHCCIDSIRGWVADTCSSPNFALLQPVMAELAPAVTESVFSTAEAMHTARSLDAGRLMEAAAVQAVQEGLPEGWTLLSSLHLLGVDEEVLTTTQRGCKFEADMLVLNKLGVAVAIVEVKLAAANPLMALANDVQSLLRLVDRVAGKSLTCLTKDDVTAASAAAAAAAGVAAGAAQPPVVAADSELYSKLAAMTARPPFAQGPGWHVLHIPVHSDVQPVYVLGNTVTRASITRGLNSLASSGALKLLSRCPAALAAALKASQHEMQQCPPEPLPEAAVTAPGSLDRSPAASSTVHGSSVMQVADDCGMYTAGSLDGRSSSFFMESVDASSSFSSSSSSSSGSSGMDCSADNLATLSSLATSSVSSCSSFAVDVDVSPKQQLPAATYPDAPSAHSCAPQTEQGRLQLARTDSLSAARARIRAQLHLTAEQQQVLTSKIWDTLRQLTERCQIYSLVKMLD